MKASPFLYCLTQVGSEANLKKEATSDRLKSSFSRPGFVTFKGEAPGFSASRRPSFTFARLVAVSIAKAKADDLSPLVKAMTEILVGLEHEGKKETVHAHLFARDLVGHEDDPKRDVSAAWVAAWKARIAEVPELAGLTWNEEAPIGSLIFHFTVVEENEVWLGVTKRRSFEWGAPAGKPALPLPELAPSRAYLKIEEAIRLSGVRMEPEDRAIEVGSAPGGACYALLERGLRVMGIDRGEMAPQVAKHPRFTWKAQSILEFTQDAERGIARAEWLLIDMNTEPRVSSKETRPLALEVLPDLLGIFFTLKVNNDSVLDDLPYITENLQVKLGLKLVRTIQLPSNKSEVCFMGFTERGVLRLPKRLPS